MTNPMNLETRSNTPADADERLAYIALALVPGLGAARLAGLLSTFSSARQVLCAPMKALVAEGRLTPAGATAVHAASGEDAIAYAGRAARCGQQLLIPSDSSFPSMLRSIPDPPVILFAIGNLAALKRHAVAIVGSRSHTAYGAAVAQSMGRAAAGAEIPVISGMARGLDAVAHAAALDAGGTSIGVLGTGADIVYPRENVRLFDRMAAEGLLLTEYPPGAPTHRGAFPRRNRLISGLARALIVIEAAESSGTLVTVSCALEQGRDVLVVPGPITSATSRGTNRLIRDGATPLLSPEDMLAVFGVLALPPALPRFTPVPGDLSPDEARVLSALSATPRSIDDLALAVGLPVGLLLGTLLGLELGGLAVQLPDTSYQRH